MNWTDEDLERFISECESVLYSDNEFDPCQKLQALETLVRQTATNYLQFKAEQLTLKRLWSLPRSPKEAAARGCDRYFNGKTCANGHLSFRWARTRKCPECIKMHSNPSMMNEVQRAKHRDRARNFARMATETLHPTYIAHLLGVKVSDLTPEILEAKKSQLKLKRAIDRIKST